MIPPTLRQRSMALRTFALGTSIITSSTYLLLLVFYTVQRSERNEYFYRRSFICRVCSIIRFRRSLKQSRYAAYVSRVAMAVEKRKEKIGEDRYAIRRLDIL